MACSSTAEPRPVKSVVVGSNPIRSAHGIIKSCGRNSKI